MIERMRANFLNGLLERSLTAVGQPTGPARRLRTETIVAASLDETFAFFADAGNLERITPPWLNFRVRTPLPIHMREGTEIDYRIVLHGCPIPWRSRIDVWEPGARFVDRQVVGPYRWWRHEHRFERVAGGTRVIDDVEFVPRLPKLTQAFVSADLDRIFTYRKVTLGRLFHDARRAS